MSVRGHELVYHIFLFCHDADGAFAAAFLHAVLLWIYAFDIAALCEDDRRFFFRHQVFGRNGFCRARYHARSSFFRIEFLNFFGFFYNNIAYFPLTIQNAFQLRDERFLFFQLIFHFFALKPGKGLQAHFQNGGCLNRGESEFSYKVFVRALFIGGRSDCFYDLINVIKRYFEAFQNMRAFLRFFEIIMSAALNHHMAVFDEFFKQVFQRQHLWL